MTDTLTPAQQQVCDSVLQAVVTGKPGWFSLRGYAGTGKTVTTSHIITKALATPECHVVVATPTATALSVVQSKLGGVDRSDSHPGNVLRLKTFSSIAQTPTPTVSLGPGLKFRLNNTDLPKLHRVLSRMKIDDYGLVHVTHGRMRDTIKDLSNPEASIQPGWRGVKMYFDKDVFRERVEKRFGSIHKSPFSPKVDDDTEFITNSAESIANSLISSLGKHPRHTRIGLVVVDEASMIPDADMAVLKEAVVDRLGAVLLVCGDPAQIPPINGAANQLLNGPDDGETRFTLTDILRSDDVIAQTAQKIRARTPLRSLTDTRITSTTDPSAIFNEFEDVFSDADVVLSFTNKAVNTFNMLMRFQAGRTPDHIDPDEYIMATKNTHGAELAYMFHNGDIFQVKDVGRHIVGSYGVSVEDELAMIRREATSTRKAKKDKFGNTLDPDLFAHFIRRWDNGEITALLTDDDRVCFTWSDARNRSDMQSRMIMDTINNDPVLSIPFVKTTFANAVTVNKSQGSEWDNVVYVSMPMDRNIQPAQLPYTAVTRARKKLTIIYAGR